MYTGTVFERRHLCSQQVVLLLRRVHKGEPSTQLSEELGLSYLTVLDLRHRLQANAVEAQMKFLY